MFIKNLMKGCGVYLLATACMAQVSDPSSAYRQPGQDWHNIKNARQKVVMQSDGSIVDDAIAWNAQNLDKLQLLLKDVPSWPDYKTIKHQFNYLKKHAFLIDPIDNSPKAIPWRYAVDYCYQRAAAAAQLYNDTDLPRPAKVFAFGNLRLFSIYAPNGILRFWYHVAPIVRDKQTDQIYVLDPAINFDQPTPLITWLETLVEESNKKELDVNICNGYAVGPGDSCKSSNKDNEDIPVKNLVNRLPVEKHILESKGIIKTNKFKNANAKMIYGTFEFKYTLAYSPLIDQITLEYKNPNENDWKVLWDTKVAQQQMELYDYAAMDQKFLMGDIFAKPSRDSSCMCSGSSCACELSNLENKVDFRVKVNDKVINQCTYQYPASSNINYQSFGPDIHYHFDLDAQGRVENQNGEISDCK